MAAQRPAEPNLKGYNTEDAERFTEGHREIQDAPIPILRSSSRVFLCALCALSVEIRSLRMFEYTPSDPDTLRPLHAVQGGGKWKERLFRIGCCRFGSF